MEELLSRADEEAEEIKDRQRKCAGMTTKLVDELLEALQQAQQAVTTPDQVGKGKLSMQAIMKLTALQQKHTQLSGPTKELHASINKLGKAIDKAMLPDVSVAYKENVELDHQVLDKVIAEHFFHDGAEESGECFIREAKIANGPSISAPYKEMQHILKELKRQNLEPCLEWLQTRRTEFSPKDKVAITFDFKLHRLRFLTILAQQGRKQALAYARMDDTFATFGRENHGEIGRLMGFLCYAQRPNWGAAYPEFTSMTSFWEDIAQDFVRLACGLQGKGSDSPLLVTTAAGGVALPSLIKMYSILKDQSHDLTSEEQLPVEIDLGPEFVFSSIYSCPVSREQCTLTNPPMLLPCGHVLCKISIAKIARSPHRGFKCPYCPVEASLTTCREIRLGDWA